MLMLTQETFKLCPDWVTWIGVDYSGSAYGFNHKPKWELDMYSCAGSSGEFDYTILDGLYDRAIHLLQREGGGNMTPYPSSRDTLSFELLENAGYKRYEQSIHQSDYFYQKCFRNEAGDKIYWLDIGIYDFTKYRSDAGIGYQCELKLHVANVGFEPRYLSITVHDFSSLIDLETYCATLFSELGGVPDTINND